MRGVGRNTRPPCIPLASATKQPSQPFDKLVHHAYHRTQRHEAAEDFKQECPDMHQSSFPRTSFSPALPPDVTASPPRIASTDGYLRLHRDLTDGGTLGI
jgi:hypothetical protein